ncbi:hypothetical protein SAMN05216602_2953 [Pseudomonas argentinensis]|uniref:Uncharacterized protein n=2 Tax=Phytopseudomonas argentinensis TaxID=289370 RepID=A0A1I3L7N9_9GAMM|nr:hypothetical protein SAMN05216602_2953 [Pseudomonas argentinensis]
MHRQTIRYARNGALGAIGFYLMIALPLLAASMQAPSPSTLQAPLEHALVAPVDAGQDSFS